MPWSSAGLLGVYPMAAMPCCCGCCGACDSFHSELVSGALPFQKRADSQVGIAAVHGEPTSYTYRPITITSSQPSSEHIWSDANAWELQE
jgi:hypothetical protein